MTSLADTFNRLLPLIEADLHTVLAPPDDSPPAFYRMLHYHMGWVNQEGKPVESKRGKRVRPALALMVCQAACGDFTPARPAAAAVEMIHNFSLLHDDIQDQSPTRRGRNTVWSIWGVPQAINAGDALFTLAFLAISRLSPSGPELATCARMVSILGETCLELTRGQHLDISFESRDVISTDEYLDMIDGKTAALLAGSAHLGALAGQADESAQGHYRAFGRNLGLAFQVLDDVLDIWGDPELTGKEAAVDIQQRKKSLPVLYGLARSPELADLYARPEPFGPEDITQAIRLLDSAGAREYAENLAKHYSAETLRHLEEAGPQSEGAQVLVELVEMLLNRKR